MGIKLGRPIFILEITLCRQPKLKFWRIRSMRTITFLFLLLSGTAFSQLVEPVQKSFITKTTATWCTPCGGWGWDLFEAMIDDNANEAILVANHYSGDLQTQTAVDLANNFGVTGQPQFFVGNDRVNATSSTASTARTAARDAVVAAHSSSPLVGAGMTATLSGQTLTVNSKIRFFASSDGEYYRSFYLLEDEVVNRQANRGNEAIHERVLRGSIGGGTFGESFSTGAVAVDAEFTSSFSHELNASWNPAHLILVTVIWKKEGNTYTFVNASETRDFSGASSSRTLGAEVATLTSFSESGILTSTVIARLSAKQATLALIDAQGRVVEVRALDELGEGRTNIRWQTLLVPGYYAVRLQTEAGMLVKGVVVP